MKNKKGFTLIEIIVVLTLISVIGVGSFIGIRYEQNKKLNEKRNKVFSVFDNALNVYLSNHEDIYTNLSDNVEGAVITFELLKNDGLVDDNIIDPKTNKKVDYLNNYYVLADAVQLANNEETEEENESSCEGQVELTVIKSWEDISDRAKSEVLYICPKNETSSQMEKNNDETTDLKNRVAKLEKIISSMNIGDNNYVAFKVEYKDDELANFGSNKLTTSNLWRLLKNSSNSVSGDKVRLMYNQPISVDYSKMFPDVINDIVEPFTYYSSKQRQNITSTIKMCSPDMEAIEIKPGSIGDYFASSNVGYMQKIYYTGNKEKFYEYVSYNSKNSCTNVKEIPDFKAYIYNNSEYALLSDNYKNYYYNKYNYKVDFFDDKERVDYISIFDLNSTNPIKENLVKKININHLKPLQYKYVYRTVNSNNPSNDESYSTYFGILTPNDLSYNENWLINYSIPIGIYQPSWGDDFKKIDDAMDYSIYILYSSYGERISYTRKLVTKNKGVRTIYTNGGTTGLTSNTVLSVSTAPYYPVINLKDVDGLITDINDSSYSNTNYKQTFPDCSGKSEDLGTMKCPYLIKFTNGDISFQ